MDIFSEIALNLYVIILLVIFLVYPIVATLYEVILIILPRRHAVFRNLHDIFLLPYGWCLTVVLMNLLGAWSNDEMVSSVRTDSIMSVPVSMACRLSFYVFLIVGYVGLITLRIMERIKMSALLAVLSIGAMYLSVVLLWALSIQSKDQLNSPILMVLLPVSSLAIAIRAIKDTINELCIETGTQSIVIFGKGLDVTYIPLLAVVGAVAIYIVLNLILMAFGQPFNGLLHAFSDTIGHTFSVR